MTETTTQQSEVLAGRPTGAPCWIDLMTSDPDRAIAFYSALFGWAAERGDQEKYGGYVSFSLAGRAVAGAMAKDGEYRGPDTWSVYLATDDASATAARVREAGGQVMFDPMPVPGLGAMSFALDPSGAGIGFWQADPFAGFEVLGEPGAPAWFELHTSSYERDLQFYRDAFGWQTEVQGDTDEFRYATIGRADDNAGGVMDASSWPEEAPREWTIYFAVADCDASCAKAIELGASIVDQPEDTPYGRMATLVDPMGARFKVLRLPEA